MTQAARDALRHVDAVLAENSEPLKTTIANLQVFSEGLARNTGKLDGIVAGLERMTAGSASPARKITYDLRAASGFPSPPDRTLKNGLFIPEPTAVIKLDTQRFLFSSDKEYPDFAEAMWADSIPKLLQSKLLESFENYDIAHAPLRSMDGVQTDYQLLIDVRRFQITVDPEPVADIGLSARILNKNGKVVAARLFQDTQKLDKIEPAAAGAAFNDAFGRIAKDMIAWTVKTL
jgi:phospholipid/cholesterol/gamma-HCH transport system substrate-binding protein